MDLDNFKLEQYDELNVEHRTVVVQLDNEKSFLGSVSNTIKRLNVEKSTNNYKIDNAYIAYYNDYPIGFICIQTLKDKYEIRYGILDKYRKQNIASLLLQEFSYKILDDFGIDELTLLINESNIGSKKVAELVGYKKESIVRYKMHK